MHGGRWSSNNQLHIDLARGRVYSYSYLWRNGWKQLRNLTCYRSEGNTAQKMVVRGDYDYGRGIDFHTLTLTGFRNDLI